MFHIRHMTFFREYLIPEKMCYICTDKNILYYSNAIDLLGCEVREDVCIIKTLNTNTALRLQQCTINLE